MRRTIALPYRSADTPAGKRPRDDDPPPMPPRVTTHDAQEQLDNWKAARRALVEAYDDIMFGVTPRVFYMVAGKEANHVLTKRQLGEKLVEFITGSMQGSVPTELTVNDVFKHIELHPHLGEWVLYDFFYTSASEGNLPRWHSLAKQLLSKLVELCGRVMLQDAASRNHVPVHLYRWLKLNEESNEYVDIFDNRTSYYGTAGFEWHDWQRTEYEDNVRKTRNAISARFRQWWIGSRDEISKQSDILLHACPDEYMKLRMREYEMPLAFAELDA